MPSAISVVENSWPDVLTTEHTEKIEIGFPLCLCASVVKNRRLGKFFR